MLHGRVVTETRFIRLRYPATCSLCGAALPARTEARWDREARAATCRSCVEADPAPAVPTNLVVEPEASSPPTIVRGDAGASAARRFEKLHKRREQRSRERFGRLSAIHLALTEDPQSTRAWATGSQGERALGQYLEKLHESGAIIALHDRRIPGTRANIDHIAIAPTGIYAIDAKKYAGKVQCVDKGGWFSTDWRLYVGRRDCTKLVLGMAKQVDAIRTAMGQPLIEEFDLKVHPALCFVDSEWGLFARPFEIRGVWVGWSNALGERLQSEGWLEPEHLASIAKRVAKALPPA